MWAVLACWLLHFFCLFHMYDHLFGVVMTENVFMASFCPHLCRILWNLCKWPLYHIHLQPSQLIPGVIIWGHEGVLRAEIWKWWMRIYTGMLLLPLPWGSVYVMLFCCILGPYSVYTHLKAWLGWMWCSILKTFVSWLETHHETWNSCLIVTWFLTSLHRTLTVSVLCKKSIRWCAWGHFGSFIDNPIKRKY